MHRLSVVSSVATAERRRWLALGVVCLAQLMIVLDTTIVNVALPAIQRDLHFTQGNLTWVVDAFLVTFGSFLLLAGRLGDLFGRKRVFLAGVVIFTVASALCGLAPNQGVLIAARFIQGIGAAVQASAILAIVVTEFPEAERPSPCDERLRVRRRRGRVTRPAGRRCADADALLELDLLRQSADRGAHDHPRPDPDPGRCGTATKQFASTGSARCWSRPR